MNLCMDIGNTNTKFGLFDKNELKLVFTSAEVLDEVLRKHKIENAIVSRTGANEEFVSALQQRGINIILLSHLLRLPIQILYSTPETLGADRIAGTVAANSFFPNTHVLKIDFGTCITFDFVNNRNQYLGGAISPGMMMRFKALNNYTSKLPLVDPARFNKYNLTGTDTSTSILSGVVNGIKNEVQGIIKEYNQRYGTLKVVTTGGDAAMFATVMESEIFARPYLVLEGLNIILNHNL